MILLYHLISKVDHLLWFNENVVICVCQCLTVWIVVLLHDILFSLIACHSLKKSGYFNYLYNVAFILYWKNNHIHAVSFLHPLSSFSNWAKASNSLACWPKLKWLIVMMFWSSIKYTTVHSWHACFWLNVYLSLLIPKLEVI